MVGVLSAGGLDISRKLLDQTIKPCKVSLESLVLFFRQKDILIFSKGQIGICCFYQVVIFQVVLITLVSGTTLIISKKPGNTGISRDIRTEFTTDLLLSD